VVVKKEFSLVRFLFEKKRKERMPFGSFRKELLLREKNEKPPLPIWGKRGYGG